MVDHGASVTGARDLYHLPIQSIWMPGSEVHTNCMADHEACIMGAMCRMLCNGWVQSPRPLEHSIQCRVYCTKEGPVGMSKAQKTYHADSKAHCQLPQDWYRTRKLVAIFVTCWARVRNYHIRAGVKFMILKSPEIACSREGPDISLFDTKINSKDKDPELVQSKSCEMHRWQT
jgi:hypothetical protein